MRTLLYLIMLITTGCGPEQNLVNIEGVLTPIKITENYGRGGDGHTIRFNISSDSNLNLVVYGFVDGEFLFSPGGKYYNKDVEVVYRVNKGLVSESKNKAFQTYSIDKISRGGNLIYED
ncbi:hypothetical protein [Vibrio coralliilyticus]|uniref:hypothetical protein n=1 Tax=Vibrio coralliilyticus TaxID=190893 RepID=UPI00148E4F31|nr:hypothetical protein [Vibrio coralliilyticus]